MLVTSTVPSLDCNRIDRFKGDQQDSRNNPPILLRGSRVGYFFFVIE